MHFEDTNGSVCATVTDESGYGNDGVLGNCSEQASASVYATGISGTGLKFDGLNDYVNVSSYSETTNSLTVEAWSKTAGVGMSINQVIVSQEDSGGNSGRLLIGIQDVVDDTIYTNLGGSILSSGTVPNANQWYHSAITFDGTNLKIYVDGVEKASTTETLECNNCPLYIGRSKTAGTGYFNGTIDEVAIYSKALTAGEIQNHYNSKRAKFIDYRPGKNSLNKDYGFTALEFDGLGDHLQCYDEQTEVLTRTELTESEIYELINTHSSFTLKPVSSTSNSLPLMSSTSSKSMDKAFTSFSGRGGWIRNTMIPEDSPGGNRAVLRKSESLLSSTAPLSFARDATLLFLIPFGPYSAENPLDSRNLFTAFGKLRINRFVISDESSIRQMFSSSWNLKPDIMFSPDSLGGILQGPLNHLPIDAGILLNDLFSRPASSNQFNDIGDQNSGSFKDRLSVAYLRVGRDVLSWIHFNNNREAYLNKLPYCPEIEGKSGFCEENGKLYSQEWKLFSELSEDELIATLNPETQQMEWHKPYRYISYHYTGTALRVDSEGISLLVTPDHQMYASMNEGFELMLAEDIGEQEAVYKTANGEVTAAGEWVDYDGMVYDVTVRNHILLVRRRISGGNSDKSKWGIEDISTLCRNKSGTEGSSFSSFMRIPERNSHIKYSIPLWSGNCGNFTGMDSEQGTFELWFDSDNSSLNYTLMAAPQEPSTQDSGLVLAMDFDGPADITDGAVLLMRFDNATRTDEYYGGRELPNPAQEKGLVLYMMFNNDSANGEAYNATNASLVYDHSGWGNTGKNYNGTYNASSGRFNGAFEFEINGSYVTVEQDSSLVFGTGNFTVELWIKLNTLSPSHQNIIGNRETDNPNSWWFGVHSNGSTNYDNGGAADRILSATGEITAGVWYHIAVVRSGGASTTYKNGVSIASGADSYDISSTTENLEIGRSSAYPAEWVNGTIDEVMIWNRNLSAAEIAKHAGTYIEDYSGLENFGVFSGNGTQTGTAWNSSARFGGGFEFDGDDDYIDCGNDSSLNFGTGDFTLEAWIKTTCQTAQQIINKENGTDKIGYLWVVSTNGNIRGSIRDASGGVVSTDDGTTVDDGNWHHVACVFNRNGNLIRYVDGVVSGTQDSISSRSGSIDNTFDFRIGTTPMDAQNFNGTIDEVRIYNRTLSPDEINWSAGIEVEDLSWLGNDGVTHGNGSYDYYSKFGGAFEFDGNYSWINVSSDLGLSNSSDITMDAWAKSVDDPPTDGYLLFLQDDVKNQPLITMCFRDEKANYIHVSRNNVNTWSLISNVGFTPTEWNHFAVTVDGSTGTLRLFVNGVDDSTSDTNYNSATGSGEFIVGVNQNRVGYFNGTIDSVRVYNRSLSAEEVRSHYLGTSLHKFRDNLTFHSGTASLHYNIEGFDGFHHLAASWEEAVSDDSLVLFMQFNNDSVADEFYGGQEISNPGQEDSMVLYMKFNNESAVNEDYNATNSSYVYDYSGEGNSGRWISNASAYNRWNLTNGKYNGGIRFDGNGDWVNVSDDDSLDVTKFTLEAWIKASTDTADEFRTIINKETSNTNRNFWLTLWSTSDARCGDFVPVLRMSVGGSGTTVCGTSALNDDVWHHVAVTYDQSTMRLYVDGVLDNSTTETGTPDTSIGSVLIGAEVGTSSAARRFFNGTIDEVRVYSRALTAEEIAHHSGNFINDYSPEQNFGVMLNNGTKNMSTKAGKFDRGMEFDGEDDYIDCGNDSSLNFDTGDFSISMWFKLEAAGIVYLIDARTGNAGEPAYGCYIKNGGSAIVCFSADDDVTPAQGIITDATGFNDNTWHHLTFFRNGVTISDYYIYVDGERQATSTEWDVGDASNIVLGDVILGARSTLDQYWFNGTIDQVMIYSRALTPEEIQSHYLADYRGGIAKLYIDGILATDGNFAPGGDDFDGELTLASDANQQENWSFDGALDSVAVYSRALPESEILEHYNNGIQKFSLDRTIADTSSIDFDNYARNLINVTDEPGNVTLEGMCNGARCSGYTALLMGFENLTTGDNWTHDFSGKANHGEVKSNALRFDGSDDYVEKGNAAFAANASTIELWFKADSVNTQGDATWKKMTLIQYGDIYWGLQINSSPAYNIQYHYWIGSSKDWYSSDAISIGQWYHLVAVSDASGSEMFLNGVSQGTSALTLFNNTGGLTRSLIIGGDISGDPSADSFDGTIDEVRIYNRTLSAAEIKDHYNNKFTNESRLVLWIPFGEGSGNTSNDYSGQNNNGTLENFADVSRGAGDTGTSGWTTRGRPNRLNPVPGKAGQGFEFDDGDDHIEAGTTGFYQTEGSVEAWFKPSQVLDNHTIFSAPQEGSRTAGGLVGYWKFNNDSSVGEAYNATNASLVYDYSGLGNYGHWDANRTIVGGGWNSSGGKFGGAFVFDGLDDYVNITQTVDISDDLTIETWIKPNEYEDYEHIVGANDATNGNRIILQLNTSGIQWFVEKPTGENQIAFYQTTETGTWHHLAGTVIKDSEVRLYLDGVEVDSITSGLTTPTKTDSPFTIGGVVAQGDFKFNGTIDEVRIYNRSLMAEEIKASYLGLSLFKHEDNLVFHSGNSTLIYDVSSWGDQWRHLTGTWSNSTRNVSLYIDGTQTNLTKFREGGNFNQTAYIGSDWRGHPSYTADGIIDEIRVLNLSLDADSIEKSYNYTARKGEFQHHISLNYYNTEGNLTSSVNDLGSETDSRQNLDLSWNEPLPYGEEFDGAASHGLISYWSFDENKGNVTYDQSLRGGNNGTLYNFGFDGNNSDWVVGRHGYALRFDGDDDYVDIGRLLDRATSFSIEAWAKNSPSGSDTLFNGYFQFFINLDNDNNRMDWRIGDGSWDVSTTSPLPTANEWHHFVATWDGSTFKGYIDASGVVSGSTTISDLGVGLYTQKIGAYAILSGGYFNGTIDSVAIYDRALTAAEIQSNYNRRGETFTSEELSILMLLHFNNNDTSDSGPYANDGIQANSVDCTGGENQSNGIFSGACKFDGLDDIINSTTYGFSPSTGSIESWFKFDAPAENHTILSVPQEGPDTGAELVLSMDFDGPFETTEGLVGWWRFDNDTKVGECYDNETEILTDKGWKHFSELDRTEKVATLNPETGETEFHLPYRYQNYKFDGDMYRIETEQGSLLVSPEHKVFGKLSPVGIVMMVKLEDVDDFALDFIAENEAFENMNSPLSREVISEGLIPLGILQNLSNLIINCLSQDRVLLTCFIDPSPASLVNIEDIAHLHSNMSSIDSTLMKGPFSASCSLLTKDSFKGSSSTGCQSILSQNSHSSSEMVPVLMYLLNISLFNNLSLATSDQFTQGNLLSAENSLSSSEKVMLTNQITPFLSSSSNFCSLASFSSTPSLATSGQLTSGISSSLSFNSLDIDTVNLFIFDTSCIDKRKCVNIYRDFELKKDFGLMPVKEAYELFKEGREVLFMDEDGGEIRVKSITKEPYSGKIYDVTVDNHIILVRRDDLVVWSGNSYNATNASYVHDYSGEGNSGVWISNSTAAGTVVGRWNLTNGRFGGGIRFDGDVDHVNATVTGAPTGANPRTVEAWVKASNTAAKQGCVAYGNDAANEAWGFLISSACAPRQWALQVWGGDDQCTGVTPDTNWHHHAATYDGSTTRYYIDGVLYNTSTVTVSTVGTTLEIGRELDGDNMFNGTIDEVRIYDRALSAAEINWSSGVMVQDKSGFGNHGNVTNASYDYYALFDGVFEFDGSHDTIQRGTDDAELDGFSQFTGMSWVKINQNNDQEYMANKWWDGTTRGWAMIAGGSGKLQINYGTSDVPGGGSLASNSDYPVNTWFHYGVTYDGSTLKIYIDGKLDANKTLTGTIGGNTAPFTIGCQVRTAAGLCNNGDGQYFNGTIDEVRIYNRSLSAEEVKGSYLGLSLFKHDDNLVFHAGNATITKEIDWNSSDWHYAAGTWENSSKTAAFYLDGSLVSSTKFREGGDFGNSSYIGSDRRNSSGYTLNGSIDELRILNNSLAASEVREDYTRGIADLYFKARSGDYYKNFNQFKVLSLRMDADPENSSRTLDSSGFGNDGSLSGGAYFGEGYLGTGMVFDGSDDYVNVSDSDSLGITGPITLECWAKMNSVGVAAGSLTDNQYFISKASSTGTASTIAYTLLIANTGDDYLRFQISDGTSLDQTNDAPGLSVDELSPNVWYHIVGVYDGSYIYLYLDGVLKTSETSLSSIRDISTEVRIGELGGSTSRPFNGTIDEVNIYSRALTANEVKLLYESYNDWSEWSGYDYTQGGDSQLIGLDFSGIEFPEAYVDNPYDEQDLVGYWRFENGSGGNVSDSSRYGNNGTCKNMGGGNCNWTTGKVGLGIEFDGSNDYINCGNDSSLKPTSAVSMSAWAKVNSWPSSGTSLHIGGNQDGSNGGHNLLVVSDGTTGHARFNAHPSGGRDDADGTTPIPAGTWFHITGTYDGTNARVYRNGVLEDTDGTYSGDIVYTSKDRFEIGCLGDQASEGCRLLMDGTIDELAIWKRVLTQAEIRSHFSRGFKRIEDDSEAAGTGGNNSGHNNFAKFPSSLMDPDKVFEAADPDLTPRGKHGSAIKFDGLDDYLKGEFNSVQNLTNASFTALNQTGAMEAWVKPATAGNVTKNYTIVSIPGEISDGEEGLVLLMHFNNGSGSHAIDSSGLNNNGTCKGMGGSLCNWTTGRFGQAIEFDGSNDYVNCGDDTSLDITGAITIEAWIYPNAVDEQVELVCRDDQTNRNYVLYIENDNTIQLHIWSGNTDVWATSNTTITTGQWYHLVGTYDGSQQKIYINGILDGTPVNRTGAIDNDDVSLIIGARALESPPDRFFDGLIDEVAIFNRSLSAEEIRDHYLGYSLRQYGSNHTAGLVGLWHLDDAPTEIDSSSSGLVALYHFNTGGGNQTVDNSTNSNTGTCYNFSGHRCNWTAGKFGYGIEFDGTNDYINVSDDDSLTFTDEDFSIEAWIKTVGSSKSPQTIVAKRNAGAHEYQLLIQNGKIQSGIATSGGSYDGCKGVQVIENNTWYHIAFTADGSTMRNYIDGVLDNSTSITKSMSNTASSLIIGSMEGYIGSRDFNGTIDEVAIWNTALSGSQIKRHAGTNASDSSGQGNDGNLTGFNWTSVSDWTEGKFSYGLRFDGNKSYVEITKNIGDAGLNLQVGTIEAWFKVGQDISGNSGEQFIVDIGSRWVLGLYPHGSAYPSCNNGGLGGSFYTGSTFRPTCSGTTSWSSDEWHHVAYVINTDNDWQKLYLDGNLVNSTAYTDAVSYVTSRHPGFGSEIVNVEDFFNGALDEIAIWSRALSSDEIRELYHTDGLYNNSQTYVRLHAGNVTLLGDATAWQADSWHHVAGWWNLSHARLYLDSKETSMSNNFNPGGIPADYYTIGGDINAEFNYNGSIDSVAVYNRRLMASEVREHYLDRFTEPAQALGDPSRYLQWRAFLSTGDTNVTPRLNSVTIQQPDYRNRILNSPPSVPGLMNTTFSSSSTPQFNWTPSLDVDGQINPSDSYGLRGYWSFDFVDGMNITPDLSGNDNDGICYNYGGGGCNQTDGVYGYGMRFDGVDDRVDRASTSSLNTFSQITLEAWIYPLDAGSDEPAIAKEGTGGVEEYLLGINTYEFGCLLGNGWPLNTRSGGGERIQNGVWQHIACTWDGSTVIDYLNGVSVDTDSWSGSIPQGSSKLSIGANSDAGTTWFNGTIDEVAIWARALNESEIQDRFQQDGISYEFVLANASNFNVSNITAIRFAINNYTRQYWDEYTVFVENFDSVARIQANNGTIVGNFSICEGRFGKGGCFDGNSSYVDYGDGIDPSGWTKATLEVWIKSDTGAQDEAIVGWYINGDGGLFMQSKYNAGEGLLVYAGATGNDFAEKNIETTDGWVHAVLVYDGSLSGNANRLKLYANGVLQTLTFDGSASITSSIPSLSSTTLKIGDVSSLGRKWNGSIDEVRISKIARRPVSALWTLNYTLNSSTEAMRSGARYYWKVRALDSGGEEGEW